MLPELFFGLFNQKMFVSEIGINFPVITLSSLFDQYQFWSAPPGETSPFVITKIMMSSENHEQVAGFIGEDQNIIMPSLIKHTRLGELLKEDLLYKIYQPSSLNTYWAHGPGSPSPVNVTNTSFLISSSVHHHHKYQAAAIFYLTVIVQVHKDTKERSWC